MSTLHGMVGVSLAAAGMAILGCQHTDSNAAACPTPAAPPAQAAQAAEPMGVTSTQAPGVDASIVDRLASARCDREQSCDNIGDGRKYASRRICMEQLRGRIGNDLNSYQCPGGIDDAAVTHCVAAIDEEQCGAHPIEALTRIDKCRSGAMCITR